MQSDTINPVTKSAKGKKYPVTHKRPQGRIIERGANQFQVWIHSHTDSEGRKKREAA